MTLPGDNIPASAPKSGMFEDLIDVFVRPKELFERYRNGSFVRPALLQMIFMLVVTVAALSLIIPYYEAESARAVRQSGQAMPENAAAVMGPVMKATAIGAALLVPWLIAILGGLATWIAARIVGAKLSYKQSAVVSSWSYTPSAILGMLALAVFGAISDPTTIRGVTDGQLGPGRFVDPETTAPVLLALYQQLDVFAIWGLFLTATGVMIMARKDLGTGMIAALIRFAIVSLFTIVPALLRG